MSTRRPNQSVKLTKTHVDRLAPPTHGQAFLRDALLKGFAVRVTANGVKSFVVEKRINGRVKRITLGRYPDLTVEQARKEAQKNLGKIATGLDPVAEKEQARLQGVTLREAFADFLKARHGLKDRTVYDYRRIMEVAFPDWLPKPLLALSKDMIARRHASLGEDRGQAYANLALRVLRAVLNFARARYEDRNGRPLLLDNPVQRLTQTRAWFRVGRRRTVIKPHQLPAWYRAVAALKASPADEGARTVADYLLLVLFTGLRRQEAATLTWENVDLPGRTLTIPDPKNHEPLTLPLSDFVHTLLSARAEHATSRYVFPGTGEHGYLIEPKRQLARVIKESGVPFVLHDLRRTFITVAESLDIPAYALKRLLNHKMSNDVTAGYIVMDAERLRRPMQLITDFLLRAAGIKPALVVELPDRRPTNSPAAVIGA